MGTDNVANETYGGTKVVDPKTLQFYRALKDPKDGYNICKKILSDCSGRIAKDAAIMSKYNDAQPWDQAQLEAAGQGWRNNRATGFLSSLIRRAIHPYKQTIDLAKYLTNSMLPENVPNYNEKSEEFQFETTRVIRQWDGWNNFTYLLILEDILFGHGQVTYTDTIDWRPTFSRSDDCCFSDGTPQVAEKVPLMVLKQSWQIHELAAYLKNPEASKTAGWNIDKMVTAINDAQPANRQKGDPENIRKYEDTVRETTMGRSYSEGVKVVDTYHLFIQEATGKVSHYLYNAKNGDILFKYEDQFESMKNVLCLFTLEVGNGTVYGSKGAGRVLYNTHVAIEQGRNLIADALYLSGLLILKTTTANKKKVALTVTHPFCVVGDGYEIVEHNFKVNAEAFFSLDRHMSSLSEIQIGVFMPGMQIENQTGGKPTASQINYMAAIEQQIKEGVLARFRFQFNNITAEIQRRMYSEENIKKGITLFKLRQKTGLKVVTAKIINFMKRIAIFLGGIKFEAPNIPEQKVNDPSDQAAEAIANLMEKGLSPVEIFILGMTPPDKFTTDPVADNPANLDAVTAKYKGDGSVDQEKLKKIDISQKLGQELADELVIPGLDQTIQAEAVRMQLMENSLLAQGESVPVSPRDNNKVHMDVIMEKSGDLLKTATPESITKISLDALSKFLEHFDAHLQAELQAGVKPEMLKTEMEFSDTAKKMIGSLQGQLPSTPQGGGASLPAGHAPMAAIMNEESNQAPETNGQGVPVEAIGNAAVASTNKPLSRQVVDTGVKTI